MSLWLGKDIVYCQSIKSSANHNITAKYCYLYFLTWKDNLARSFFCPLFEKLFYLSPSRSPSSVTLPTTSGHNIILYDIQNEFLSCSLFAVKVKVIRLMYNNKRNQ